MNILFISEHCCIRVVKQAIALNTAGHNVVLLQKRFANQEFQSFFNFVSFYVNEIDFKEKVIAFAPQVDVIHVHNEPDWMTVVAKRVASEKPVVFDVHDFLSIRHNTMSELEMLAMSVCDGVIVPGTYYYGYAQEKFPLGKKPVQIIRSMVNEVFSNPPQMTKIGGIVYQGGVVLNNPYFKNRDYRRLALELRKMQIPFVMYPTRLTDWQEHENLGAMIHMPVSYPTLIRNMTRYHWGWVGPGEKHYINDTTMPNKVFDYLAAGLPSMVFSSAEAAKFVEQHGIGVVIEKYDDIKKYYRSFDRYRQNAVKKREELVMESQTDRIIDTYKKAIEFAKNRDQEALYMLLASKKQSLEVEVK